MATVIGALGQANPAATVLTDLYTVLANKGTTARVIITNRAAVNDSFRVSIAPNGAADSLEQYVAYDKAILANDTGSTIAVMLGDADVVRVRSTLGNLSFTITGVEEDIP